MNVTVHIPPFKVTGATFVVHRLETGPVGEMHFQPEAGFQVFRSLADIDAVIGAYVALRAEYGEAEALYAARPLMPPPQRDAGPGWAAPVIEMGVGAFMEVLIDPDCIAGKHASCMGGPCTCSCHDGPVADIHVVDEEGPIATVPLEPPPSDLPHRAPLEAPVGEPVCGARGEDPEDVCTASPHGAGDHARFSADGSVAHQWLRADEDATTS